MKYKLCWCKIVEKKTQKQRGRSSDIALQVFKPVSVYKIMKLIVFLFFYLHTFESEAQELRFTQLHASDTWLNPAFTGIKGRPRIEINFRDQWPEIPQTYVSYRIAGDIALSRIRSGIGIFAVRDDEGNNILNTTSVGLQYSYQAQLSENIALNIGLQCSYNQKSVNFEDLQFYDQINPIYGFTDAGGNPNPTGQVVPGSTKVSYYDFAAGALLFSNKWFFGFSVLHANQPEVSFYSDANSIIPMAYSAQAGLELRYGTKKDNFSVNPMLAYSFQSNMQQISAGSYFRKNALFAGLFMKSNLAELSDVSFIAGLNKGNTTLAYSYDLALGSLSGNSGGAHELSVVILFKEFRSNYDTKRNKHALDCPSVF